MSFDQRFVSSGVTSVVCLSLLLSACAAPCRCPASSAASGSAATAAADSPSAERVTRTEASGVIYDLQGCWKSGRNDVRCEYMGVSPKVDRKKILLAGNCGSRGQTAFDDQGNQYRSLKVSLAATA